MSGRLSPSVEAYAAAGRYGSQKNTSSPMGKLGRSMRRVSDAKHVMKSLVEDQSRDARRFADADINGDQKLDFDEFLALQPARVRKKYTKAQIRSWFDQADLDRSGTIDDLEHVFEPRSRHAAAHSNHSHDAAPVPELRKSRRAEMLERRRQGLCRAAVVGPVAAIAERSAAAAQAALAEDHHR